MAISKIITGAAWRLTRKFKGAELEEVASRLTFQFYNALRRMPYDASWGKTESEYKNIVLANAVHRVARELIYEARIRARTVSIDAISLKQEEVCDD